MARRQRSQLIVLPVVADGGLAVKGTGGGRMIPVMMVDLSGRPSVRELLRMHEHLGQGDCHSQWGQNTDKDVFLRLRFERPIEMTLGVVFELPRQAHLVDSILTAHAMYLQHGVEGDRMSTTQGERSILIELPSTGFEDRWEKLFPAALARQLTEAGMKRSEAKTAAADMVQKWRTIGSIRLG